MKRADALVASRWGPSSSAAEGIYISWPNSRTEKCGVPTFTPTISDNQRRVLQRDRLNGLLHEYHRQAA